MRAYLRGCAHCPHLSFQQRPFRGIPRHPESPRRRRADYFLRVASGSFTRIPLVQRAPCGNVHGRCGFLGVGRRHWHRRRNFEAGNPHDFNRRHFYCRAAVRRHSGGFLQAHREARLSHVSPPPSLRTRWLGRIENYCAILDRGAGAGAFFAHDAEVKVGRMRPGFDLEGKRVLVVGLGRTGLATSLFAVSYGATVTATDMRTESDIGEAASNLGAAGVKLELGGHVASTFVGQDLIVVSPGVSPRLEMIQSARSSGVPLWSEIELARRFLRGKLVAITGSNGKTTTTSLVGHILRTAGINTLTGGNIGVPLLSLVESTTDSTITVAEVSSFQLETIEKFRPDIGILLNLTPDHLDRHTSFEEYAAAKMRLFENQLDRDFAVLNADDPEVTKRMPSGPHIFWFSRRKRVVQGAFLQGNQIMIRHDDSDLVVGRRDEISLRGEHNLENVLA